MQIFAKFERMFLYGMNWDSLLTCARGLSSVPCLSVPKGRINKRNQPLCCLTCTFSTGRAALASCLLLCLSFPEFPLFCCLDLQCELSKGATNGHLSLLTFPSHRLVSRVIKADEAIRHFPLNLTREPRCGLTASKHDASSLTDWMLQKRLLET